MIPDIERRIRTSQAVVDSVLDKRNIKRASRPKWCSPKAVFDWDSAYEAGPSVIIYDHVTVHRYTIPKSLLTGSVRDIAKAARTLATQIIVSGLQAEISYNSHMLKRAREDVDKIRRQLESAIFTADVLEREREHMRSDLARIQARRAVDISRNLR